MPAAACAMVFRARHEQLTIGLGDECAGEGGKEARPTGTAVELHVGCEQRLSTSGAYVGSFAFLAVERAGKRTLGTFFAQHAVLIGRQRAPPVAISVAAPLVVF